MPTPAQTRKAVIDFITPYMDQPTNRQALVNGALWGEPFVANIDWSGTPTAFSSHLFEALYRDGGVDALKALLDEIATHTGRDNQARINQLKNDIAVLPTLPTSSAPATPASPPTNAGPTINIGGNVSGSNVNIGGTQTITTHNSGFMGEGPMRPTPPDHDDDPQTGE